jgi:hypothetical protein
VAGVRVRLDDHDAVGVDCELLGDRGPHDAAAEHVGDATLDRDVVVVEVGEQPLAWLVGADGVLAVVDEVHLAVLGDDQAGAPGDGAVTGQAGVVAEGEAHDRPSRACSSRCMAE